MKRPFTGQHILYLAAFGAPQSNQISTLLLNSSFETPQRLS